ncbi:alpha/beta hydrolase [Streptomyces sp. RFCAC02]|uniref:alpha/beta fold hydrolase n=1 Tax=Streptomyces sp. RFCAC02 TaxID=2499143 RepID=UPI00101F042C|nr:alpha/beta hydrolase [Streptomyces sp. RFCAC02]
MPFVTAGNARVHYTVAGTGPALVLVHGTGPLGAEGTWGALTPAFTDRRTVIAPDLPGAGRTTDDGEPLTVERLAGHLAAVIEDAAGRHGTAGGPVTVLGFSLGAPAAIALAALRPDLVDTLVTVAGWACTADDAYLANEFALWRLLGKTDPEAFGRCVMMTGFSRTFLNTLRPAEIDCLVAAMPPTPGAMRHVDLDERMDVRHLLRRVRARTLVIGCTQDATVPVEHSRALHAAIRGAQYAELDTGHGPFFEQPGEFAKLVRDFLPGA